MSGPYEKVIFSHSECPQQLPEGFFALACGLGWDGGKQQPVDANRQHKGTNVKSAICGNKNGSVGFRINIIKDIETFK